MDSSPTSVSVVKKPYILITGQSDHGIPGTPNSITILNDPNLVRWFAQNLEAPHPKLVSVPSASIVLSMALSSTKPFAQSNSGVVHGLLKKLACEGVLTDHSSLTPIRHPVDKPYNLLVNFGPTHPSRQKVGRRLSKKREKAEEEENGILTMNCSTKSTGC